MNIVENTLDKSLLIGRALSLILLLVALLAGCATVSVNSNFDPEADFSNLKTYAWAPRGPWTTGDARIDNNPLLHTRIHDAIDTRLTRKGFQLNVTGTPDFWIQYDVIAHDKKDVKSFRPSYFGGPDSKWDNYIGNRVTTFHYTEGTLIINIADPQTKELIWRGMGNVLAEPDASPKKKIRKINNAVAKTLAEFPP